MSCMDATLALSRAGDHNAFLQRIEQRLADPKVDEKIAEILDKYDLALAWVEQQKATQLERVRERAVSAGYRIMHRRKGQFWLVLDKPMTLDAIEEYLTERGY